MDLKEQLVQHFRSAPSAPFLFIGSGFSRRYLGLEDWKGLLRRFSTELKPFEYYLASGGGNLAAVASIMANDFHDLWWNSSTYEISREKHKSKAKDKTSALRIEISNYLHSLSLTELVIPEYKSEIEILSRLNVDGIITTNWDLLLEQLFPDYRVFIGQSELLFSNPQSIGEIYKIHGSASRASSLVLTKEDYEDFEDKNPYLAAKLITLFVEHPIVFLGYSLTDRNISNLLKSVVSVLGSDKIEKLRNNLIFVQRQKNEKSEYSQTFLTIDGGHIPITIVKSNSFVPVYEALDEVKRRIPARVLRFCKEQLYELVKSSTPETKLCVVDIDVIEKKEDIEFLVGVGVASETSRQIGYQGIGLLDLFKDGFVEDQKFDPKMVINKSLPAISGGPKYIPIFKYLNACGIDSREKYKQWGIDLDRHICADANYYKSSAYTKAYLRDMKNKSAKEIIEMNTPEKAAIFLAFLPEDKFDFATIRNFLYKHQEYFDYAKSSYASYFRKLACLYDWFLYGWERISLK